MDGVHTLRTVVRCSLHVVFCKPGCKYLSDWAPVTSFGKLFPSLINLGMRLQELVSKWTPRNLG